MLSSISALSERELLTSTPRKNFRKENVVSQTDTDHRTSPALAIALLAIAVAVAVVMSYIANIHPRHMLGDISGTVKNTPSGKFVNVDNHKVHCANICSNLQSGDSVKLTQCNDIGDGTYDCARVEER